MRAAAQKRKKSPDAKSRPTRSTRHDDDTHDHVIGQDNPRAMSSTGKARIEPGTVEVIDRVMPTKEKLEALKFDQEELMVLIHDSTNPTDDPIPYVINGGRRQAFIRGQKQKVKRMYVEILARMKKTTYTQTKEKDSQGIDTVINHPHTALVFPFSVIHDPNPRGAAWLEAILAEAG